MFKFVLFFFTPVSRLRRSEEGQALYRRYSSSVFLACITERFSQHFTFFCPHSICSGNGDTDSTISGNVGAHSDPFSSSCHRRSNSRVAPISVHDVAA